MGKNSRINKRISASIETNGRCYYCGDQSYELEHMVPKARGGGDEDHNLTIACVSCNAKKLKGSGKNSNFDHIDFLRFERRNSGIVDLLFYGQIIRLFSTKSEKCCLCQKNLPELIKRIDNFERELPEKKENFALVCRDCSIGDKDIIYDLDNIPKNGRIYPNFPVLGNF